MVDGPLQVTLGCADGLRLSDIMAALRKAGYVVSVTNDPRAIAYGVIELVDVQGT